MSIEMLIVALIGIQTVLVTGTMGLVAILLSSLIGRVEQQVDVLREEITGLCGEMTSRLDRLEGKVDQLIWHLAGQSSREEARP